MFSTFDWYRKVIFTDRYVMHNCFNCAFTYGRLFRAIQYSFLKLLSFTLAFSGVQDRKKREIYEQCIIAPTPTHKTCLSYNCIHE